jgi:hypothetical protein
MKATEMLNQVKDLLGIEAQVEEVKEETPEQTLEETQLNEQEETVVTKVELEQRTLENGTVIEADSFETGKEVFIITEEEKVALPVGDYTLDDGKILKVEEEGVIASIEDATAEDVEEEMAEVADWEGMEKRIQNLEDAVAALKADKISNQEEKEVKEELSEVEKVSHNPETETEKEMNLYAQNRNTENTLDRVMKTIANFN